MKAPARFVSIVSRFGSGRGNAGGVVACSCSEGIDGTRAPSTGRRSTVLATLVLATLAAALTASPAGAAPPTPSSVSISNVKGTSVHVSGEVLGGGLYSFEISTDEVNWSDYKYLEAPSPSFPSVSDDFTGLKGGTKYFVRIVTTNGFVTEFDYSPTAEFETLFVPKPTVLAANDATAIFSTTAQVSGSVERPAGAEDGIDAECLFEYVSEADFQPKNEEQSLTVRATGGTFTLGFEGQSSPPIAFDAPAASVQAQLESLSSIGAGAVSVTGGPGDEAGTTPYAIAFDGALAGKNVETISVDPSALSVEGEAGAEVQTSAGGHPEGFNDPGQTPCKPNPVSTAGPNPVSARLSGLDPTTTYHLRLAATNAGGSDSKVVASTFTTTALPVVLPPTVLSADDATEITATTAKVSGSVERPIGADPLFDADCYFEYLTDAQFAENEGGGAPAFEGASKTACEPNPVSTAGPNPVSATLTGLVTGTTYHLRLTASNVAGSDALGVGNFKTRSVVVAQTAGLSALGATSATLAGEVNPDNAAVTYQFEWGVPSGPGDETYENVAPAAPEPLSAADKDFHAVTAAIAGLGPATEYHYRVVATYTETGGISRGVDRTFTTYPSPPSPQPCPNESSRVGPSANLPDCRAYEWVTPDSEDVRIEPSLDYRSPQFAATSLPDGSAIRYTTDDAVGEAAGSYVQNIAVARRGPAGWASKSFSPPASQPSPAYLAMGLDGLVSNDFTEAIVRSPAPLAGPSSPPSGMNLYISRKDGTYTPLSLVGVPFTPGSQQYEGYQTEANRASGDWSHIFFRFGPRQRPGDPADSNTYEWFNGEVNLVGVLPGGTPAPRGAALAGGVLPASSYDGRKVLFNASGFPGLYLRTNGQDTVEVGEEAISLGITPDGSEVLFMSRSELTADANTGESEGVPTKAGRDIYSYDVASGEITDLTPDHKPADAATGANVTSVVGSSADGSYLYFVATGDLGPGAISGQQNLYVEHDGEIDFVAPGADVVFPERPRIYVTPDGLHAAFNSASRLTGYDNAGQRMIYEYTYKGGLVCVSCRPDGAPPIARAETNGRVLSDDGTRAFFSTADPIFPEVTNGLENIYEYEQGELHLLTPGDGTEEVFLLDASASGNDVFIETHEELSPQGQGHVSAIYDARVNAEAPQPTPPECAGESCLSPGTSAPQSRGAGSATFEAPGEVTAPKSMAARAKKLKLRITVPESGQITVSGKGIKTVKRNVAKAGPVTLTLTLKPGANKTRLSKGVFKTKAQVLFKPKTGSVSRSAGARPVVALKFEGPSRKGGK